MKRSVCLIRSAPRQRTNFRHIAMLAACAAAPALASVAWGQETVVTWTTPGTSQWEVSTNWSPNVVPNNSGQTTYGVYIAANDPAPVVLTDPFSYTIGSMKLDTGTSLTINTNGSLSVVDSDSDSSFDSALVNNGTINIGELNSMNGSTLSIGTSAAQSTITGNGSINLIQLGNATLNLNGSITEIGTAITISGAGQINSASGSITNDGTINANLVPDATPPQGDTNLSAGGQDEALIVQASGITNSGTIKATGGGELDLGNGSLQIDNSAGGSIFADASSSIYLNGVTIAGGTLGNSSITQGTIQTVIPSSQPVSALPVEATLDGQSKGTLQIADGTNLVIPGGSAIAMLGEIDNTGTVSIVDDSNATGEGTIQIGVNSGDTVTWGGSGTTALSGSLLVTPPNGGINTTLINATGHTITGGTILMYSSAVSQGFVNNGTVINSSLGNDVVNNGLLQNCTFGFATVDNSGGRIDVTDGNSAGLIGDIEGGTITTEGSGELLAEFGFLDGADAGPITNSGTVSVVGFLDLDGTITNNGIIQTGSNGNPLLSGVSIVIGTGGGGDTVTLNGTGTLLLTDANLAVVQGVSGTGTETLINDTQHTIAGSGTFQNVMLTNNGTISVPGGGNITLSNLTNYDSATGTLTGGNYVLTGTLTFDPANITTLNANVILNGAGAGMVNTDNSNALGNLATIGRQGSLTVAGGASFTTTSSIFTNLGNIGIAYDSNITFNNFVTSGTTSYHILVTSTGAFASSFNVTSLATLSGDLDVILDTTLDASDLAAQLDGQSFTVLSAGVLTGDYDNTLTGRVEAIDDAGEPMGSFAITYDTSDTGDVILDDYIAQNVPEPTMIGLAASAAGLLLRRRRRA